MANTAGFELNRFGGATCTKLPHKTRDCIGHLGGFLHQHDLRISIGRTSQPGLHAPLVNQLGLSLVAETSWDWGWRYESRSDALRMVRCSTVSPYPPTGLHHCQPPHILHPLPHQQTPLHPNLHPFHTLPDCLPHAVIYKRSTSLNKRKHHSLSTLPITNTKLALTDR